jgi:acylphosphatase
VPTPAGAWRNMIEEKPQLARLHATVSGHVQMVGYRAYVQSRAEHHGLTGYARNLITGAVDVVAEGDRQDLEAFLADLSRGPRGARVDHVMPTWEQPRGEFTDFSIRYY